MNIIYNLILLNIISLFLNNVASGADLQYLQAVHVLDPGIEDFKYYNSWNSDQWIQWVRHRYIENDAENSQGQPPLYGLWVNIIIISSTEEINSAFSKISNKTYTNDLTRQDYYWSDIPFTVFVVVRKPENVSELESPQSQYNVYSCTDKKMFISAKVDSINFNPILVQTFFPKKVKNPKDTLRIPLIKCKKVSQVRGLLDEIKFQLGSGGF